MAAVRGGADMTAEGLTFAALYDLAGRRFGVADVPCPSCGPERRNASNKRRPVLRVWFRQDDVARYPHAPRGDVISFTCQRCQVTGIVRADSQAVTTEPKSIGAVAKTDSDADRTAKAVRVWRQSVSPTETVVARYLANRGLALPPDAAGEAIRYHPRCPFGRGVVAECMVALVRDTVTDLPVGIHRTALSHDGRKAEYGGLSRMTLGPIGGGAVKLTPDADVGLGLGIGEGIESTLSLRRLPGCESLAVWALLAANQVAALPVLPGVEGLWVAVDHDLVGAAAAGAARDRWQAAGVDVVTAKPTANGADLNDFVRSAAHG